MRTPGGPARPARPARRPRSRPGPRQARQSTTPPCDTLDLTCPLPAPAVPSGSSVARTRHRRRSPDPRGRRWPVLGAPRALKHTPAPPRGRLRLPATAARTARPVDSGVQFRPEVELGLIRMAGHRLRRHHDGFPLRATAEPRAALANAATGGSRPREARQRRGAPGLLVAYTLRRQARAAWASGSRYLKSQIRAMSLQHSPPTLAGIADRSRCGRSPARGDDQADPRLKEETVR